ncbi:NACHT, LRR and PYD domains-containing protein 3-like isoform X3 [Anguilla rostrata]|uniref:NACHT, LRR and PYD domains-containing protein 3-like isoform X3 n=1 Tax=Anguilla rostrata TaxID=7938 RepID=UPI0030D0D776
MKSEKSMDRPIKFRGDFTGDQRIQQSLKSSSFEEKSSDKLSSAKKPPLQEWDSPRRLQSLLRTLMKLMKDNKLKRFKSHLRQDFPECFTSLPEDSTVLDKFMTRMKKLFKREQEDPEALYIVEKMLETCGSERSLKITLHILRRMKQTDLADSLERDEQHNESIKRAQQELKTHLKKQFECIFEGLAKQGNQTLLNDIYTELYITEGGSGGVNNEHEVRQIETASKRQTTQETAILCNDIFKPLPGQEKPRTVLTKGIAGIGKTVSVQKFILDWAEGKANQDIDFIFTLPFRDLNLKKEKAFSLMHLLQHYFPQVKEIKSVEGDEVKVVLIFDGLDECRLPLDFQSKEICHDVTESSSVDVLLTNLIKGNLLPSALLWITSRPAAANQIPPECVHQVTEVRGFNDPQKEEYFRKRIRDQNLASSIISHIKSSRSLYIMCHIPVFCWISATVLETMLGETESGDLPKTLTEMYTYFLLIQTNVKNQKYHGTDEADSKNMSASDTEIILKLGKLAFRQLEKGNLIFYEEDLRESSIDVSEASVYSGVCTEIFKEECGLYQEKVYCFVHLSIQEYLAALFVFHSCVNENRNVLRAEESKPHSDRVQLSELHRSAVDQALESKNGHLDLFLRFLLGLSLESIQSLLGGILTETGSRSESIEKTVQYIKDRIREESSADRTINLFHCLNELNDNYLVQEIQNSLRSGKLSEKELEPDQCSALAFVLLMSEEILDEFDLKTYKILAAGHQRLVPVVRNCRKAILNTCKLTQKCCNVVASALQSSNSPLRDLDLSYNNLGDSGVELLCAGLRSPNCKLQRLGLSNCDLTVKSCDILASAPQSSNSPLTDLDLSCNDLGDSGVELLSAGMRSPNCKLQRLGLVVLCTV